MEEVNNAKLGHFDEENGRFCQESTLDIPDMHIKMGEKGFCPEQKVFAKGMNFNVTLMKILVVDIMIITVTVIY